ncbi:MAG: hypothetical protein JWM34_1058 [Ilumatobacteraceae bacterium]|nr:hypothetical protein [Ilumatobacteraceae bacterium]
MLVADESTVAAAVVGSVPGAEDSLPAVGAPVELGAAASVVVEIDVGAEVAVVFHRGPQPHSSSAMATTGMQPGEIERSPLERDTIMIVRANHPYTRCMDPAHGPVGTPRSRLSNRGIFGIVLAVGGVVFIFLGWYGVSGRPTLGEEMPYLASGTIPGAAMLVAAAVMLAGDANHRSMERTNAMMSELHTLLVEAVTDAPAGSTAPTVGAAEEAPAADALVAGERSDHVHRADCMLVVGKPGFTTADVALIRRRGLSACPVCEPDIPEP